MEDFYTGFDMIMSERTSLLTRKRHPKHILSLLRDEESFHSGEMKGFSCRQSRCGPKGAESMIYGSRIGCRLMLFAYVLQLEQG
jgi:hypothetical protein